MLDLLELDIPFKTDSNIMFSFFLNDGTVRYEIDLTKLDVSKTGIINHEKGKSYHSDLRHKYESLKSSMSGMGFKIYHRGQNCNPFVRIKCSPCKLLQGHNLYGFDCLEKGAINMLALLFFQYPFLQDHLDINNIKVSQLDITYSIPVKDRYHRQQLIQILSNCSSGQIKASKQKYDTSVYFGLPEKSSSEGKKKSSTRLVLRKVYLKYDEMINSLTKEYRRKYPESAIIIDDLLKTDLCKHSVRFESSIRKRYLERNNIPTKLNDLIEYIRNNPDFYTDIHYKTWKPILDLFENYKVTDMDNIKIKNKLEKIYTTYSKTGRVNRLKAKRLFSFYLELKTVGYQETKSSYSSSTFHRNISDLVAAGISHLSLQNFIPDTPNNVIPFPILINFDYSKQLPNDYVEPIDLFG